MVKYGVCAISFLRTSRETKAYCPFDTIEQTQKARDEMRSKVEGKLVRADISKDDVTNGILLASYVDDGTQKCLFDKEYYIRKKGE